MMDTAMTYTLFEFAKENGDDMATVPLAPTQVSMIRPHIDTHTHHTTPHTTHTPHHTTHTHTQHTVL